MISLFEVILISAAMFYLGLVVGMNLFPAVEPDLLKQILNNKSRVTRTVTGKKNRENQ